MRKDINKIDFFYLDKINVDINLWEKLSRKEIDNFKISGSIVDTKNINGDFIKIKIIVNKILTPDMSYDKFFKNIFTVDRNKFKKYDAKIFFPIKSIFKNFFNIWKKSNWVLIGHIDGDYKEPIIIIHSDYLFISIYSIDIKDNNYEIFFKKMFFN